jgi:hypothetical protein
VLLLLLMMMPTVIMGLAIHRETQTLVLKKVAHASAPRQHQLGNIYNDLGLLSGRQCCKPFRQTLFFIPSSQFQFELKIVNFFSEPERTYNFALSREQDEIAVSEKPKKKGYQHSCLT